MTSEPVTVAGGEEGQALDVVPVQVGQQERPAERSIAEEFVQAAEPRAGIEHQSRNSPRRRRDSATQEVCPPKRT